MAVLLGGELRRLVGCCLFGDSKSPIEFDMMGLYRTDTLEYAPECGALIWAEYNHIIKITEEYEFERNKQVHQSDGEK